MDITIYHNPNCSKSRKTLELIQDAGETPTIVEYLINPPDVSTLRELISALGINAKELLRSKEPEFNQLKLGEDSVDEQTILQAMVAHPILIERPIVAANGKAVIGRPPENVNEILSPNGD